MNKEVWKDAGRREGVEKKGKQQEEGRKKWTEVKDGKGNIMNTREDAWSKQSQGLQE